MERGGRHVGGGSDGATERRSDEGEEQPNGRKGEWARGAVEWGLLRAAGDFSLDL